MKRKQEPENQPYSKQQLITLMHEQILGILSQAQDAGRTVNIKETDQLCKLASSVEKLENRVSLQTTIQVFTEFNKWLCSYDIEFAKRNNEMQDKYLNYIMPK
jgi:hypothetical protein